MKFGQIHGSLVVCEWCGTKMINLRGQRVFEKEGKKFVKYVGHCPKCNGIDGCWSQDITPEMANEARMRLSGTRTPTQSDKKSQSNISQ